MVKPPSRMITSFGSPCHKAGVPCASVILVIGFPASRPKEKHALITPEKMATISPLLKLNSLIDSVFCSADISFSFDMPAIPANVIPTRQTPIPSRITRPDCVPSTLEANSPLKAGGIRVPKAAHKPITTAMPSDMPR